MTSCSQGRWGSGSRSTRARAALQSTLDSSCVSCRLTSRKEPRHEQEEQSVRLEAILIQAGHRCILEGWSSHGSLRDTGPRRACATDTWQTESEERLRGEGFHVLSPRRLLGRPRHASSDVA